jgi:hypothetical protein
MTPSPDDREQLERLIEQTVRDLPPRRAPKSLEGRVLAEIARRAALPWWRRSFVHWPLPARAAFLVACLGIVKLFVVASIWILAGFDSSQAGMALTAQFAWVETGYAFLASIAGFFEIVFRNIPPLWLYGGLAFFTTMYLALFGLGAAAYRTLYATR